MAGEERSTTDSLITADAVVAAAPKYGFFATVSLLERLSVDAARVGGTGSAHEEAIRFRHDPAMTFSSADVSSVTVKYVPSDPDNPLSPKRPRYEVVTTFLGLTGACTPLPLYIAEEIASEDPQGASQREFLDIFHHRLLSLFYRWRTRYEPSREYTSDLEDSWSKRILAMAGIDTFEGAPPSKIPLWQMMRLAPMLAAKTRNARSLEIALEEILGESLDGAKIRIEQFFGRWVDIDVPQRIKLGVQNTILGKSTVLGTKVFDRGGKFRIVMEPVTGKAFRRFLPDGDQLPIVKEIVGLFCRDQLDFDMELVLDKDATPRFRLSKGSQSRLGVDTWLGGRSEQTRVVVDPSLAVPGMSGTSPVDENPGDSDGYGRQSNEALHPAPDPAYSPDPVQSGGVLDNATPGANVLSFSGGRS